MCQSRLEKRVKQRREQRCSGQRGNARAKGSSDVCAGKVTGRAADAFPSFVWLGHETRNRPQLIESA